MRGLRAPHSLDVRAEKRISLPISMIESARSRGSAAVPLARLALVGDDDLATRARRGQRGPFRSRLVARSDKAANLAGARELTGRPTFRLYGL